MPTNPEPESHAAPRRGLRYYMIGSAIVLALSICYVGFVFFSRWQQNRAIAEKAAAARRAQAEQTFQRMGGDAFDILAFYASPQVINRGGSASLCYSVSNAKSVSLDPPSNVSVWPSYERCVTLSPSKTTTYTLTATDAAAHTKSAQATIEVH
jgi:cbb3-type cytochrome oxidase subunit 3